MVKLYPKLHPKMTCQKYLKICGRTLAQTIPINTTSFQEPYKVRLNPTDPQTILTYLNPKNIKNQPFSTTLICGYLDQESFENHQSQPSQVKGKAMHILPSQNAFLTCLHPKHLKKQPLNTTRVGDYLGQWFFRTTSLPSQGRDQR